MHKQRGFTLVEIAIVCAETGTNVHTLCHSL